MRRCGERAVHLDSLDDFLATVGATDGNTFTEFQVMLLQKTTKFNTCRYNSNTRDCRIAGYFDVVHPRQHAAMQQWDIPRLSPSSDQ